jgi:CHASE2 domain-containing sensor protein/serine phosphatase RsbU (regulator of sigma subunit)
VSPARLAAASLLAFFGALILVPPAPVDALRENLFDAYQRLFPRERQSAPATIVEIDERTLAERGQWPWPRTQIADLVTRIAAAKPAAIGIDMLLSEPDRFSPRALAALMPELPESASRQLRALPSNDSRLAAALRGRNVVMSIAGLEAPDPRRLAPPAAAPVRWIAGEQPELRRFPGWLGSLDELDRAAAGRGLISSDATGRIVRRVPLIADVAGTVTPALTLEMWRVATGTPAFSVREQRGGLLEVAVGDLRIPAQRNGSIWLRYSRHDPARFVSAADVLGGKVSAELFRSKLVLVGVTGLGLLDFQATPLGERVPGVEIHAQLIEQVFDNDFLVRPAWAPWLEAGLLIAAVLLLMWIVPARRVPVSTAALIGVLAVLLAAGFGAFLGRGILLDIAWPVLGVLFAFSVLLAATLAEADGQRRVLREAAARSAGELAAAYRIQMGLLPDLAALTRTLPSIQIAALLEPARTVGGDFFDCLQLDRSRVFFVVGDVSGKGMPAAVFMALCKATIKAAAARGGDLGAAMTRASAEISRENPEQLFVTAFAGILDVRTGMLECCNAGHEPPYVLTAAAALERLPNAGGPPLCTLDEFEYVTAYRELGPGDSLLVLSDGVTEAMNERLALYGSHQLELALKFARRGSTPAEILGAVRDDVRRFVGNALASDDLTLLVLRWTGPSGSGPESPEDDSADVDLDAPVAGLLDPVGGRH